jgi:CRISPR-associated protein Csm2
MSTTQTRASLVPASFFEDGTINLNNLGKSFVETYFMKKNRRNEDEVIVSTSQIRQFLSGVNSIQNKLSVLDETDPNYNTQWQNLWQEIQYLRIKLAYQAGRADRDKAIALDNMKNELDPIIDKIDTKEKFNKFARLVESIVAYHKYCGGN